MMITNVLVSLTRAHPNESAVRTALALARFHHAQQTAIPEQRSALIIEIFRSQPSPVLFAR